MPGLDWMRRLFWRASLGDHAYRFLFDPPPPDEVVSLDCETTGLDPRSDDIVAVAAVRIRGNRILTSERFEAIVHAESMPGAASIKVHRLRRRDVAEGRPIHRIVPDLLRFIGARPIVGYYIDFDMRLLDRYVLRLIETKLPNPRVEVSSLYYERKYGDAPPGTAIDLRFATILADLGIPPLEQHDAFNDALMAAMMYVALRDLQRRGVRIRRERAWRAAPPPTGG